MGGQSLLQEHLGDRRRFPVDDVGASLGVWVDEYVVEVWIWM